MLQVGAKSDVVPSKLVSSYSGDSSLEHLLEIVEIWFESAQACKVRVLSCCIWSALLVSWLCRRRLEFNGDYVISLATSTSADQSCVADEVAG